MLLALSIPGLVYYLRNAVVCRKGFRCEHICRFSIPAKICSDATDNERGCCQFATGDGKVLGGTTNDINDKPESLINGDNTDKTIHFLSIRCDALINVSKPDIIFLSRDSEAVLH